MCRRMNRGAQLEVTFQTRASALQEKDVTAVSLAVVCGRNLLAFPPILSRPGPSENFAMACAADFGMNCASKRTASLGNRMTVGLF